MENIVLRNKIGMRLAVAFFAYAWMSHIGLFFFFSAQTHVIVGANMFLLMVIGVFIFLITAEIALLPWEARSIGYRCGFVLIGNFVLYAILRQIGVIGPADIFLAYLLAIFYLILAAGGTCLVIYLKQCQRSGYYNKG